MNGNRSSLRRPSENWIQRSLGKVTERKTFKNRILGPGVPSHFLVYWSIWLQKASNEQQSEQFASPFRKFDPEVIGEGHGAKNHQKSHFWAWCTLSILRLLVDSLVKGLK